MFAGFTYAQNFDCCNTVSEVQNTLEGDWLLKQDSRNKIYRFHFEKGTGTVDVLEELNLPPKAEHTELNSDFEITESTVKISREKEGFYIELVYSFGSVKEQIKELNNKRLVYGHGPSRHVFIRDGR
ncbi:hypothetical protein GCM10022260_19140 [Gaetbulibacter aestuarii]